MSDLRSYYGIIFAIGCGHSKDDDPNDWYDCDGYGSY